MARTVQLKHEIMRFNPRCKSDFIPFDDLLVDLKLTPSDMELPIPNYFREVLAACVHCC